MVRMTTIVHITKKILLLLVLVIAAGVVGYIGLKVYDRIAQAIVEKKIKEAGLNPSDYDLRGIAPWNIREFVTNTEIEKASADPDNYDFRK
ncbi:MAG: hypothetical protein Greene041679_132 [Parcubacteria group bacterium Greene0416_79]|nr:MAG: hypothetical protein Greene041679_132 [Parcubacteria group bacterium Greene0416_79]